MPNLIPYGEFEAAGDLTTESLLKTPGTKTREAAQEIVGPLVTEALTDPEVTGIVNDAVDARVDTAVDEKVDALDLSLKSDPGVYNDGSTDDSDEVAIMASEVDANGTAPKKLARLLNSLQGWHFYRLAIGARNAMVSFRTIKSSEYMWGLAFSNGKPTEMTLTPGGLFPPGVVRRFIRTAYEHGWIVAPTKTITTVYLDCGGGQSNMESYAQVTSAVTDRAHNRHFQYEFGSGAVSVAPANGGLSNPTGGGSLGSYSALTTIARETLRDSDDQTVVISVNAGVGSSGLVEESSAGVWAYDYAGANPKRYPVMLSAFQAAYAYAQATYPSATIIPRGWWIQGEQDDNTTRAAYLNALVGMIGAFRTATGLPQMGWVTGGLVPNNFPTDGYDAAGGRANIRRAQIDAQASIEYYAYTDGVPNGGGSRDTTDYVHYTREGQEQLGRKMLKAWKRAATATTTRPPHWPIRVWAEVRQGRLEAWWDEPDTRFTDFVFEYSLNGGTTWTTQTGWTCPAECRRVVTGLTVTQGVAVRVSTVNGANTIGKPTIPVYATLKG